MHRPRARRANRATPTMAEISCIIETPQHLLDILSQHLSNIQEAEELFSLISQEKDDYYFSFAPSSVKSYSTLSEAFEDIYPGSVDNWKREKCEDYQLFFTDFTDLKEDWILDNDYRLYYLTNKIIIIIP